MSLVRVELGSATGLGCATPARHLQSEQQGSHRQLGRERDLVAGHLHRYPGCGQGARQDGDAHPARTHDHRHLVPRHPLLQMGLAQQIGDVLGLGRGGITGEDTHAAAAAGGDLGTPKPGDQLGIQPRRKRQPGGHGTGRRRDGSAESARPQ